MIKFPFQIEYARSDKSTCKGCLKNIPKHSLRIARVFKSLLFDGNQLNWFHRPCFFKYHRPVSVFQFLGFEQIRHSDQQRIRQDLVKTNIKVKIVTTRDGRQEARMTAAGLRDFAVEYAKSGRSKCRLCEEPISKMEIRVKKMVFDTEIGMKHGGEPLWYHLICFAKVRTDLGWFASGKQLPGFQKLRETDKSVIFKTITAIEMGGNNLDKTKTETNENRKLNKRKYQSKVRRGGGCQNNLNKLEMVSLLKANQQDIPKRSTQMVKAVVDMVTLGALVRCPTCGGQFVPIDSKNFACEGHNTVAGGLKCEHVAQQPSRKPFRIPDSIRAKLDRNRNFSKLILKLYTKYQKEQKYIHV